MKLIRKVYTTDPDFKFRFDRINAVQSLAKGLTHGGTVVEYIVFPEIGTQKHKDRNIIDWSWFQKALTEKAVSEGFTSVCYHITPKYRNKYRLSSTINGAHVSDKDRVIEYYVTSSSQKEFDRDVLHEEGHEFDGKTTDPKKPTVHHYLGEIEEFYRHVDLQPSKLDQLKAQLVALLAQLNFMKRDFLQICTDALGTDVTPDDLVPDVVACAITVSTLIRKMDSTFPLVAGTWTLYDVLEHARTWQRIETPVPGCIVLSPTGMGKAGTVGHVGVYFPDGQIASNNSATGKFEKNYTMATWKARYADKQGMPILLYAKRGTIN